MKPRGALVRLIAQTMAVAVVLSCALVAFSVLRAPEANAAVAPVLQAAPGAPGDINVTDPSGSGASISLNPGEVGNNPSQAVTLIVLITLISVAPALLLMTTAFTRIIIVLGLVRNGLGLPTIPPNQVLAGLALILSAFVMWPTWTQVNEIAIQPYSNGEISASQAFEKGQEPVKVWMLKQTSTDSLGMFIDMAKIDKPETPEATPLYVVLPAFLLSELKTAFIIGMVVLVSFLAIDLIVTSVLMSLGMMMVPPTIVALPLKILVFVLANGWVLITTALVAGFR